jgi:uncharacterized protein (DUF58 family)
MAEMKLPNSADENLLTRRPWYVAGVVLMAFSLIVGEPLLVVVGLLVVAIGAVPDLWYRFCLSSVLLRRTLSSQRAQIGDELMLTLTVENRKLLPLPHIEIRDEVPDEGVAIRGAYLEATLKPLRVSLVNVFPLWAFQRITRRYRVRCLARGVYTLGPIQVESGDPFGFLTRQASIEADDRLLVYPLVVPIERLGLPSRAPFGERTAPRRLLEDPQRVSGARAYMQGDEPRHIHWKATARTGTLQSKIYEPTTHHTLAIFVDMRTQDNPLYGYDSARLELALCAAASIATWGVEQGYAVGLYANGTLTYVDTQRPPQMSGAASYDPGALELARVIREQMVTVQLAPSTRGEQVARIHETLARVIPIFAGPMAEVLVREEAHLPFGSTVVYIGTAPALSSEGVAVLDRLLRRGHAVAALLTGDEHLERGRIPVMRLGDAETWEQLLREALREHDADGRGEPLDARREDDVVTARRASGFDLGEAR